MTIWTIFIVTAEGPTSHNIPNCRIRLFDEHAIEKRPSIGNTTSAINIPISSPRVLPPIAEPIRMYHRPHPPPFSSINSSMPITTSVIPSQCSPLPFSHPPFSFFQSSTLNIPISPLGWSLALGLFPLSYNQWGCIIAPTHYIFPIFLPPCLYPSPLNHAYIHHQVLHHLPRKGSLLHCLRSSWWEWVVDQKLIIN